MKNIFYIFNILILNIFLFSCGNQTQTDYRERVGVNVSNAEVSNNEKSAINWDGQDKSIIALDSENQTASSIVSKIEFQTRNKIEIVLDANKLISGVNYQIYDGNTQKNIVSVLINELLLTNVSGNSFMPFNIDLSGKLVYGDNLLKIRSEDYGESSFEPISLRLMDFDTFDIDSTTVFDSNVQKNQNFEGWTSIYSEQILTVDSTKPELHVNFSNMIQ